MKHEDRQITTGYLEANKPTAAVPKMLYDLLNLVLAGYRLHHLDLAQL